MKVVRVPSYLKKYFTARELSGHHPLYDVIGYAVEDKQPHKRGSKQPRETKLYVALAFVESDSVMR